MKPTPTLLVYGIGSILLFVLALYNVYQNQIWVMFLSILTGFIFVVVTMLEFQKIKERELKE